MESFLRTRVDLQQMMYSSSTMALGGGGDAHYFEDLVTPEKVRQYLNSSSVSTVHLIDGLRDGRMNGSMD